MAGMTDRVDSPAGALHPNGSASLPPSETASHYRRQAEDFSSRSNGDDSFGPAIDISRVASLASRRINGGRAVSDTPASLPRRIRQNASLETQDRSGASSLSTRSTPSRKTALPAPQPLPAERSRTPSTKGAPAEAESAGPSKPDLSFSSFCDCVFKYINVVKAEHEYQVKDQLEQTRRASQIKRRQAKASLTSCGLYATGASPFLGMAPIAADGATARAHRGKYGKFAQVHAKSPKASGDSSRYYKMTLYTEPVPPVPGYAHYSSLQHNVLVEDDKRRTFMPWQGDDDQVQELDEEKRRVEAMIERNQKSLHQLNDKTERARPYVPLAQDMLNEMGCSIEDALRFLMVEDSEMLAPPALPKNFHKAWTDRSVHLQEGYYTDSSGSDASSGDEGARRFRRPKRQWRDALEDLPSGADEKKRVAAGLACITFKEVAGFSLWNVLRVLYKSQDPLAGKSRDKSGPELEMEIEMNGSVDRALVTTLESTWLMLGCVICKRHDCPGHGEFDDTEIVDNDRKRVNFELPAEHQVMFNVPARDPSRPLPQLRKFIGLNSEGKAEGEDWGSRSSSSILNNSDLCEKDCFWVKSNRPVTPNTHKLPWLTEDEELLESFLGVYSGDRRGPCLLARGGAFNKSCMEIFERVVTRAPSLPGSSTPRPDPASVPVGRKPTADYWLENFPRASKLDLREVFYPCSHTGPCSEAQTCRCFQHGITCEKACSCAPDCSRRFQGCNCTTKAARICLTDRCPCYASNRECNPDLCRGCGAHEVLDPANKRREDMARGRCQNVAIQRAVPKRTLIGTSKLLLDGGKVGYGLYIGEPCKKDEFIGEYTGEVLSDREAETRGFIYDTIEMSYLFTLNKWQVLDSMIFGNKMRFINDQNEGMANCRPRTLLCNSVTRIGMFAQRDIDVGEELFFDYGPDFRKKFDLIKRDTDGAVTTVKRDTGGAAAALVGKIKTKGKQRQARDIPGTRLVRGKAGERPYRVSKNGRRIGRPPKALQKRRWSETGLGDEADGGGAAATAATASDSD